MPNTFTLDVKELSVDQSSVYHSVKATFEASGTEVLDHFSIKEIIEHYGQDNLLDAMDEDDIKTHLGIFEQED